MIGVLTGLFIVVMFALAVRLADVLLTIWKNRRWWNEHRVYV